MIEHKGEYETAPYVMLGPASYVRHLGERPMAITWELAPRHAVKLLRERFASELLRDHHAGSALRKPFAGCLLTTTAISWNTHGGPSAD